MSEKVNQTNMVEKENLKSIKAKLTAVTWGITRALNKIEPAVDKYAEYVKQLLQMG